MDIDKNLVGGNIKSARAEKGMTQSALAQKAEISQTQLSDYENGNKLPGLNSIAKIAMALGKSIDELCYGDASMSPITTASNKGDVIVNCCVALWEQGAIDAVGSKNGSKSGYDGIKLQGHVTGIKRLMDNLYEFGIRRDTYADPEGYLEYVKQSVASEINQEEERWERTRQFREGHGL